MVDTWILLQQISAHPDTDRRQMFWAGRQNDSAASFDTTQQPFVVGSTVMRRKKKRKIL